MRIFLTSLIIFSSLISAFAAEKFLPEKQEKRARALFLQVKCLVCEGQVIESSNTQIAFDMRKLIRDKIREGKTDQEIKDFLVANYGPEILTYPTLNNQTLALWALPVAFLVGGIIFILKLVRYKRFASSKK